MPKAIELAQAIQILRKASAFQPNAIFEMLYHAQLYLGAQLKLELHAEN